ncbi:helix-turn-helix domain-containing protein [Priestia aryabhattai]|uniref:helix-turn-helix domain-containing protein n=1 Tax=Priestia aryabhattai TaxID=412384 RepID=UPI00353207E9
MGNFLKESKEFLKNNSPELYETLFESVAARFGRLVFAKRMQTDFTQQGLADEAGVTFEAITKIEGGNSSITMSDYQKVFKVLKIANEELAEVLTEEI